MNRREILKEGAVGLGLLALLGSGVWTRRAYAVHQLQQQLLSQAASVTVAKAHEELEQLPARARQAIRLYFLGVCLDAPDFAAEVSSNRFIERLGACSSDEQRQQLLIATFERHVVSPVEVLNRVLTIAAEIGAELDDNWTQCCDRIGEEWGVPLEEYGERLTAENLVDAIEPMIRGSLTQAIETTAAATTRPALTETGRKIGESAILLLPVIRSGPYVGWPLFALLAVVHTVDHLSGWLTRPDVKDIGHMVNGRLKLLGNQVGAEFERDVRRRIADLHAWQDEALRTAAHVQAEETMPWL